MPRLKSSTRRSRSGPLNVGGGQWCERSLRVAPTSNVYHPRHVEDSFIAEGVVLHRVRHPRDDAARATAHGGVNLAQGFPDFPAPAGSRTRRRGDRRRRQPVRDHLGRQARSASAVAKNTARYGLPRSTPNARSPSAAASTEAMIATAARAGQPGRRGDRVRAVLRELRAGRDPRPARCRASCGCGSPTGRSIRPSSRPRSTTARTAIVVNTPNNPTGKVFTRAELEPIAALCQQLGRGRDHRRDLRAHPLRRRPSTSRWRRCRACASAPSRSAASRKTYSVTGWRVGFRGAAGSPPRSARFTTF